MMSKKNYIPKNCDTEEYPEEIETTLNLKTKLYLEALKIYTDRNSDLKEVLENVCNSFLSDTLDEVDSVI